MTTLIQIASLQKQSRLDIDQQLCCYSYMSFVNHLNLEAQVLQALRVNGTKERLLNIPQVWTLCSTCTGTGSFEIASKLIVQSLNEHVGMGSECNFEARPFVTFSRFL